MNPVLIAAAVRLADVLTRENAALERLDLSGAGALLDAKTAALGAFVAAQTSQAERRTARSHAPAAAQAERRALAERLGDLAATNKRLLEHAIAVQGRVVGMVVRASARQPAAGARYGQPGMRSAPIQGEAIAISTKV